MSDYKSLQLQIVELQKKADEARKMEVANVIADVKQKIKEYNLSPADIGIKGEFKASKSKTTVEPKYRDPKTGKEWTGRGIAPVWIAAALKEGKAGAFLIAGAQPKAEAKPAAVVKKAPVKKAAPKKPAAKK